MDALRIEMTVDEDGVLRVPELKAGEEVEVIVLRKPAAIARKRTSGWAKGKLTILPGFDDPVPGMEDYVYDVETVRP